MTQDMEQYIQGLRKRKEISFGTSQEADAQHYKGRLTARERINQLFDPGTFEEIDALALPRQESYLGGKRSRYGDGVITGFGLINGRHAMVASQDAAVMGGSLRDARQQD
jgi:propionyl-CoA carboxylase beta chain